MKKYGWRNVRNLTRECKINCYTDLNLFCKHFNFAKVICINLWSMLCLKIQKQPPNSICYFFELCSVFRLYSVMGSTLIHGFDCDASDLRELQVSWQKSCGLSTCICSCAIKIWLLGVFQEICKGALSNFSHLLTFENDSSEIWFSMTY